MSKQKLPPADISNCILCALYHRPAQYLHLSMMMIFALFFFLLAPAVPTAADPLAYACNGGNYTAKSAFRSNLHHLLTSLSSSNAAFLTATKGSLPDRAYGLILCRGDVAPADCSACVDNAAQDVLTLCPASKKATIWYDNCELRYDDLSFFTIVDNSVAYILYNVNNATDAGSFVRLETELLDAVVHAAAYNSSARFATGIASSGSQTIYALAQCTGDLSAEGCGQCLQEVRGYYGFGVKVGGRVLGQSCNFRYESYPFFAGAPTVSLGPAAPPAPAAVEKGEEVHVAYEISPARAGGGV